MKQATILLTMIVLLLLIGSAQAMSSSNYRLDWSTPLTGGGGATSSANYALNLTLGQTIVGASSSTSYQIGLGYWYGVTNQFTIYLPVVLRN